MYNPVFELHAILNDTDDMLMITDNPNYHYKFYFAIIYSINPPILLFSPIQHTLILHINQVYLSV